MIYQLPRRQFLRQVIVFGAVAGGASLSRAAADLAASQPRRTPSGDLLETVPKGDLPSFARNGSPRVQEAYRYAADNEETLQYMPCFCGCKNIRHRHNGDCYVTERHADGRITYNSHAVG